MKTVELLLIITVLIIGLVKQHVMQVERATLVTTVVQHHVSESHQPATVQEVAELDSDARELEKMSAELQGNVWLPGGSEWDREQRHKFHQTLAVLAEKMQRQGADNEEERLRYLEMHAEAVQDRIDILRYYHHRLTEIATSTGVMLVNQAALESGDAQVKSLQQELLQIQDELM